ncbi:MAG: hypothetical protein A2W01_09670 [Candidatus Solincola sediminis]|nr:MAG: hypothetical protein A2W01_09670 [Candidatus Solincola sediminis]
MQSTSTIWQTENQQKPQEEQDDIGRKFVATFDGEVYEIYLALESIPNKWWLTLWEMYQTSLNIEGAIQEQRVFTLQSFFEAMCDHDYKKWLVLQNGHPMGLMLGTSNIEKMRINGINADALRMRFPEAAARTRLFYLMVIYFSPELRSLGFFRWFASLVAPSIATFFDVYISDVCDTRNFIMDLNAEAFGELGERLGPKQIFATQSYYGFIREGFETAGAGTR